MAQLPDDELFIQRCGTAEHELLLEQRDPGRAALLRRLNRQIETEQVSQAARTPAGARVVTLPDTQVYRIPVVVHVVHQNARNTIGGAGNTNISDAQILSQITVLNEDYRRKIGTPGFNTNPIGADTGIEFYLATTDPTGQPTNGITRHYYAPKSIFDVYNNPDDDALLAQITLWPSDRYLNIWVTTLKDVLGFTQLPVATDTLRGLLSNATDATDGVRIDYRYFGRNIGTVTNKIYNGGRTTTHEIGHWLGLRHTWGDAVCGDDFVADTPTTQSSNNSTTCNQTFSTCTPGKTTRNLTEDYMDYSPDGCMNLFTAGQRERMRTVLTLNARRARAVGLTDHLTLLLYPNPAQGSTTAEVQTLGYEAYTLTVFDRTGRAVWSQNRTNAEGARVALPVGNFATGLYIIQARTSGERVSQRLLVE